MDHTQCLAKKETSKCARKVAKTMPAQLAKSWSPRRIRQVAKTMPAQLAKSWSTGHTFGQLCWHSFWLLFCLPAASLRLSPEMFLKDDRSQGHKGKAGWYIYIYIYIYMCIYIYMHEYKHGHIFTYRFRIKFEF